jgi:hypothetical protein
VRFRDRVLAATVTIGAVLLGPAVGPASADVAGPVVLLGTGGVRWTDVDASTPALQQLLTENSSAWLAVRSVRSFTCPADGWLAVSSGVRASESTETADKLAKQGRPICAEPQVQLSTPGGSGTVTGWAGYQKLALDGTYEAQPGLLGAAVAGTAEPDVAITDGPRPLSAAVGPGAAIALADTDGQVGHVWPGRVDGPDGTVPATELTADVQAALKINPALLAVDLGSIRDPARQPAGSPALTGGYARPRAEQVKALDARLAAVLATLPANATVIVASMADSGVPTQLQLLAARGPAPLDGSYTKSLLGSTSTRQDGFSQATDLLPTLLTAISVPIPVDAVGSVLTPVATGDTPAARLQHLNDLADASSSVTPIVPKFFNGLVIAQIVLYGVATLILRRRSRSNSPDAAGARRRTLQLLRQAAVIFACVPAASFLANLLPWWRSDTPGLAVTGAVILFVIPMAAIALLGPWRSALLGPMGAVGAITALVLAYDAGTGSKLALSSLMGVQPVVAGRFYGFGNVAFALFATGVLMLAIAAADELTRRRGPRTAAVAVLAIGVAAVVIDGTPGIGSDFGGPPAIIPAFAVLALMTLGVKVNFRRMLLIALVTIAVITALGVVDWLRPVGDRTHLGRFVQTVIDGGAWTVIQRKGEQNLGLLFRPLSALLPFAVAFVVLVLSRPVSWGVRPLQLAYDRSPLLRSGLVAFGVLMLLGAGLNDSGAAVPAVAATIAIPLLIAASVRALELRDGDRPAPSGEVGVPPTAPPPPAQPAPATAPSPGGTPG